MKIPSPAITFCTACVLLSITSTTDAGGPLRVHPDNPRYFTDDTGRAVYLTGSHTWLNLQDGGPKFPPPEFDYNQYLDVLQEQNHNFTRLWSWESPVWVLPDSTRFWLDPLPFQRTGPGKASDGRLRFDLTRFDPSYFDRLRKRVAAAADRDICVGIMLFQGFSVSRKSKSRNKTPWKYHPLNRANNINGIHGDPDGDGEGYETHTLRIAEVTRVQEAYVRRVIDTVNHLDNVIYEIGNECHGSSTEWQYHMIDVIHSYERGKPKQHPVWMSFQWDGLQGSGTNENLFKSAASAISPGNVAARADYTKGPPLGARGKIVIVDSDHVGATNLDRAAWAWRCFARGLHPIFMDDPPIKGAAEHPRFKDTGPDGPAARTRAAMGDTLSFAGRIDLAAMTPTDDPDECSTRHCLRHPGREYLVYQPKAGPFTLVVKAGKYQIEWFRPPTGKTVERGHIEAGDGSRRFTPPFDGHAVLYLRVHDVKSR
ncbi:MAG: DUF6298 domain-containing protein [Planctomycetota bacterium]|jgi:hypothetical protein